MNEQENVEEQVSDHQNSVKSSTNGVLEMF